MTTQGKKTLTKEQWAAVSASLSGFFGLVDLLVDGYTITLERRLVSKNRLGIMTFVNGKFKGEWCTGEEIGEEARRFFNTKKVTRSLPAKARKDFIRRFGKRQMEKFCVRSYSYRTPVWGSVAALRRHFEKWNVSIELVSPLKTTLLTEVTAETGIKSENT